MRVTNLENKIVLFFPKLIRGITLNFKQESTPRVSYKESFPQTAVKATISSFFFSFHYHRVAENRSR